ncbi:hypothetical protein [Neobacillus mesonae]|uniref:hypothetical protein n=1 Tax=Neobacillus mesonae TaxID=1193713 RepID=UPI00203AF7EA|nr:hypothetical protein [Neobacillus mesonae]MCM3569926.1 hypothetical protein [Neobacillus mesonae]
MGLRCTCSAVFSVSGDIITRIDGQESSGTFTVTGTICPNCRFSKNLIEVQYIDTNNSAFNFTAAFMDTSFPFCDSLEEGGEVVGITAQGTAAGEIFQGSATLSQIQFLENVDPFGNAVCAAAITANGHTFEQFTCAEGIVDIQFC